MAARATEYAAQRVPLRLRTVQALNGNLKFLANWPDNRRCWLKPDGTPYRAGEMIAVPPLARTLRRMVEAERAASGAGAPPALLPRAAASTRGTSPPIVKALKLAYAGRDTY